MIEPGVRIEGFDARSWSNLLSLFESPPGGTRRGTLVCVVDEAGTVLAAFHSRQGRLEDILDASDLASLCHTHRARRALRLHRGALEELAERLARSYSDDDDYAAQLLEAAHQLRRLEQMGRLARWPRPRVPRPLPSLAVLERALDLVLPRHGSFLLALHDHGQPFTAVALTRGARGIDGIFGPEAMGLGPLEASADRAAEARRLRAWADRHLRRVHLGIHGEADTVAALLRDRRPGAWLHAHAEGALLLEPVAPVAALGLTADGARAVAHATTELLGSSAVGSVLGAVGRYLHHRMTAAPSLEERLGWNPLEALADLLDRDLDFDVREPPEP